MTELLFDKKDIITAVNREDAEMYINTDGYYCYRFNDWRPCILKAVNYDEGYDVRDVFTILTRKTTLECPMFLPADKVKTAEKKRKPFKTIDEFKKALGINLGSQLSIRSIQEHDLKYLGIFNGYTERNSILYQVSIGCWIFSINTLFGLYEWYNEQTEEWCSFGVEE